MSTTTQQALIRRNAEALALKVLSGHQCPEDVKQFGEAAGLPNFAEATWQAGFQAGMRFAFSKIRGAI